MASVPFVNATVLKHISSNLNCMSKAHFILGPLSMHVASQDLLFSLFFFVDLAKLQEHDKTIFAEPTNLEIGSYLLFLSILCSDGLIL
jgi:hypothetical protein